MNSTMTNAKYFLSLHSIVDVDRIWDCEDIFNSKEILC